MSWENLKRARTGAISVAHLSDQRVRHNYQTAPFAVAQRLDLSPLTPPRRERQTRARLSSQVHAALRARTTIIPRELSLAEYAGSELPDLALIARAFIAILRPSSYHSQLYYSQSPSSSSISSSTSSTSSDFLRNACCDVRQNSTFSVSREADRDGRGLSVENLSSVVSAIDCRSDTTGSSILIIAIGRLWQSIARKWPIQDLFLSDSSYFNRPRLWNISVIRSTRIRLKANQMILGVPSSNCKIISQAFDNLRMKVLVPYQISPYTSQMSKRPWLHHRSFCFPVLNIKWVKYEKTFLAMM